jgi:hypothetical protein
MAQRAPWLSSIVLFALLTAAIVSGQTMGQSRTDQTTEKGRYQFIDGAVTKIFDTQTGKMYLWFPRDEKANENPYIFVQDPINGTGTTVEIKWNKKPAPQ